MDSQLKKGVLKLCVLSMLEEGDMYGYQLYRRLDAALGISESTTYPILRKLVAEGYLQTYLEPSSQGPARKYFTLSGAGRRHREHLAEEWDTFKERVDTLVRNGGNHHEKTLPE